MSDELSMQERLFYALHRGDAGEVGYVLRRHPTLAKAPVLGGFAPIHAASTSEDTRCLDVLITYGADVNQMDATFRTPLIVAASLGNFAAIDFLLEKGADPNKCDDQGINHLPLMVRDTNVIDYMVARGLRLGQVGEKMPPAIFHFKDERPETALHLVDACGCDVNARDDGGWTLAHWAALRGNKPFLEELVRRGARLDIEDKHGDSPLDKAVLSPAAFQYLLETDQALGREKRLDHAMDCAAQAGGLEAARLLVGQGYLPNTRQVAMARAKNHGEVAAYLDDLYQSDLARRHISRLDQIKRPRRPFRPGP